MDVPVHKPVLRAAKKVQPPPSRPPRHTSPIQPVKRQRLSEPQPSLAKTESPVQNTAPSTELIQFKMEPYDQGQSNQSLNDDNADDNFADDPLEDTNADDGNEDYSMMEGGDEEPQAGTSTDVASGEGQGMFILYFFIMGVWFFFMG